jgi:hypothetical protein
MGGGVYGNPGAILRGHPEVRLKGFIYETLMEPLRNLYLFYANLYVSMLNLRYIDKVILA